MARNRNPHRKLYANYDRSVLNDVPNSFGRSEYEKVWAGPINHYVFVGDENPNANLVRKVSDVLKEGIGQGIDPSSLQCLLSENFHGGRKMMNMSDVYYNYKGLPNSFGTITRMGGELVSLNYFTYADVVSGDRMKLVFFLPSQEYAVPDMVFLLEDRLIEFSPHVDLIDEGVDFPSSESDIELFRKGVLMDYLTKHKVPFMDTSR